ncbi:hypothetical protein D9M72_596410 [compost metagenome]
MGKEPALRRPCVIGAGDQIAGDIPRRRPLQRLYRLQRVAARKAEIDRYALARRSQGLVGDRNQPLAFRLAERHALPGGSTQDEAVDRFCGKVRHQPAQRALIEFAIAKRRDQRQPEAARH